MLPLPRQVCKWDTIVQDTFWSDEVETHLVIYSTVYSRKKHKVTLLCRKKKNPGNRKIKLKFITKSLKYLKTRL